VPDSFRATRSCGRGGRRAEQALVAGVRLYVSDARAKDHAMRHLTPDANLPRNDGCAERPIAHDPNWAALRKSLPGVDEIEPRGEDVT
jgi:hypothetical protein